jgi:hypothetical protein
MFNCFRKKGLKPNWEYYFQVKMNAFDHNIVVKKGKNYYMFHQPSSYVVANCRTKDALARAPSKKELYKKCVKKYYLSPRELKAPPKKP